MRLDRSGEKLRPRDFRKFPEINQLMRGRTRMVIHIFSVFSLVVLPLVWHFPLLSRVALTASPESLYPPPPSVPLFRLCPPPGMSLHRVATCQTPTLLPRPWLKGLIPSLVIYSPNPFCSYQYAVTNFFFLV